MNPQQYKEYLSQKQPKTPLAKNMCWAFLIGGTICLIGQIIYDLILPLTADEITAAAWTSISLIFLGSLLTALGIYDNIAKHAGAGTLVPITGFANAVVAAGIEFKTEGFIAGMGGKIFTIAGPIIVYGTISSILVGLISLII